MDREEALRTAGLREWTMSEENLDVGGALGRQGSGIGTSEGWVYLVLGFGSRAVASAAGDDAAPYPTP